MDALELIGPVDNDGFQEVYNTDVLTAFVNEYRHLWRVPAREDGLLSDDDKYFMLDSINLSKLNRYHSGMAVDGIYMKMPRL